MKKLLLPLILALVGIGGGVGAGFALKPDPVVDELAGGHPCGDPAEMKPAEAPKAEMTENSTEEKEYAKLNNQFIVPVIEEGAVASLVVLSLNVEVSLGNTSAVFSVEPKLRDGFLQVMFDHANVGGFSGNFTSGTNMRALRSELLRVAREIAGSEVSDVLILDIVRQDA